MHRVDPWKRLWRTRCRSGSREERSFWSYCWASRRSRWPRRRRGQLGGLLGSGDDRQAWMATMECPSRSQIRMSSWKPSAKMRSKRRSVWEVCGLSRTLRRRSTSLDSSLFPPRERDARVSGGDQQRAEGGGDRCVSPHFRVGELITPFRHIS